MPEARLARTRDVYEAHDGPDEIWDLGLSVRTANCLVRARIRTLAQLRRMADWQLLRLAGFGRVCLKDVHAALVRHGEIVM